MTAVFERLLAFGRNLSGVGLMLGTLFFAASLTPSLVPRTYVLQGVLAGVCFAAGYGAGVFWRWLWAYMELPGPPAQLRGRVNLLLALACLVILAVFLWQAAEWQNSIRRLMGLEPVPSGHPFMVSAIAIATFAVLLLLGRLFRRVSRLVTRRTRGFASRRVAQVIGVAAAILLFWSIATDVLFRAAFSVADTSFAAYDALMEPDYPQPEAPQKTGSAVSLLPWAKLGRAGREYIASGPTAAEIEKLTGQPAKEPIRVYAGPGVADDARARARLALQELIRVGAFERAALVAITPTGTGWIDPASVNAVEYLHHGDIASVAVQYSYLNSPLSLIVQPEYGAEAARALFQEVYGHWTRLPRGSRPRLYLHGLSLGALNSVGSAELFEMIGDPINGALWSGPPFATRAWRTITEERNPGTPAWLPQFREGAYVRFMNQDGLSSPPGASWGPMRVVYLQYASDPVTFFSMRDLYRRPEWLAEPRGKDVSPEMRWYPVVTGLQLALDMAVGASTPVGHGHVYSPEHYVEGWLEVSALPGWTPERIAGLKAHLMRGAVTMGGKQEGNDEGYANRGG